MMKRKNVVGLALIVVLAMSALIASGALAWWKGEGGQTYITGSQITHNGESVIKITTAKEVIVCATASFTGEFNKEVEKLTLNPTYKECKTESGKPVTVLPNGCSWTFYGGKATAGEPEHFAGGSYGLDCPSPTTTLEVLVYANTTDHHNGKVACTATIPPQDPAAAFGGEITYTNTPGAAVPDVDATTVSSEILYLMDGPALVCGAVKQGQAVITGGITLRAFSDAAHTKQIKFEVF